MGTNNVTSVTFSSPIWEKLEKKASEVLGKKLIRLEYSAKIIDESWMDTLEKSEHTGEMIAESESSDNPKINEWDYSDKSFKGMKEIQSTSIDKTFLVKEKEKTSAEKVEEAKKYAKSAHEKYMNNDYKGAIEDYTKAIELNPKDDSNYKERGSVKKEIKDYQGAIEDYTKAIELDPNSSFSYSARGYAKAKIKDYQGAIEDYTKAIELDPNYGFCYSKRADAKNEIKDYQGAIEDYTKAIELNPNYVYYYSDRADVKAKIKDYQGAIDDYTLAIEKTSIESKHILYEKRAKIKREMGDYNGAIEDYTKAKECYSYMDIVYDREIGRTITVKRGKSAKFAESAIEKFEEKNYKGVIEDYTEAIKIDSENDRYYSGRGDAKAASNDYKGAIEDYTEAIRLDSENDTYYVSRGDAKVAVRDYEGAIEDYTMALDLNKYNKSAAQKLSALYKKSGDSRRSEICSKWQTLIDDVDKSEKDFNEGRDYTDKRDFEIDKVSQGTGGDCYLLSALAKHPELIKDSGCIKWNPDGSAEVFLYVSDPKNNTFLKRTRFKIPNTELSKNLFDVTSEKGEKDIILLKSDQDFTLKAIEIALIRANMIHDGGTLEDALNLLYGGYKYEGKTEIRKPGEYNIEDLKDCVTTGIRGDSEISIDGKLISPKHAYTFNGYNPETGKVSISNPHGNDLASSEDDIEISIEEFLRNFSIETLRA